MKLTTSNISTQPNPMSATPSNIKIPQTHVSKPKTSKLPDQQLNMQTSEQKQIRQLQHYTNKHSESLVKNLSQFVTQPGHI